VTVRSTSTVAAVSNVKEGVLNSTALNLNKENERMSEASFHGLVIVWRLWGADGMTRHATLSGILNLIGSFGVIRGHS
jgi:hypothetical protein